MAIRIAMQQRRQIRTTKESPWHSFPDRDVCTCARQSERGAVLVRNTQSQTKIGAKTAVERSVRLCLECCCKRQRTSGENPAALFLGRPYAGGAAHLY